MKINFLARLVRWRVAVVVAALLIAIGGDLTLEYTDAGFGGGLAFSALGGVLAFGFLGLFLGPVVLAVGFTLMLEFAGGGEEARQGPSPPPPAAL